MLFNTVEFIFIFMPIVLIGYFAVGHLSGRIGALRYLLAASLFFYCWWSIYGLLLFIASIGINYWLYRYIRRYRGQRPAHAKLAMVGGIIIDLAVLGGFKYCNFFVNNLNWLFREDWILPQIILPLGISFFTFQEIAMLVDTWNNKNAPDPECSWEEFFLTLAFFPKLITGPLVSFGEFVNQLRNGEILRCRPDRLADGMSLFCLGLAKKILLADLLAGYINPVFAAADQGAPLSFFVALYGTLGYALQLYFDFSGYCDMAVGVARTLNLDLPINFNSPYQSKSIIEFWKRWHITLSRFLMEYLYIPMGGSRNGEFKRYRNLILTMLIGGFWHGAGWTFIVWGGLHGMFLSVNHGFRVCCERYGTTAFREWRSYRFTSWLLTTICVFGAWIVFRTNSLTGFLSFWRGLTLQNGLELPGQIVQLLPQFCRSVIAGPGNIKLLADGTVMGFVVETLLLLLGLSMVFLGKNLYEMSYRGKLILIVLSFYFVLQKLLFYTAPVEFIYFRF